jgi:hypothetical protein
MAASNSVNDVSGWLDEPRVRPKSRDRCSRTPGLVTPVRGNRTAETMCAPSTSLQQGSPGGRPSISPYPSPGRRTPSWWRYMLGRPSGGPCRQACRDSGWPAAQAQRIHSRMSAAVARKFSMSGGGAGGGCGGLGRPLPVHMAGLLAAGCTGRGRAHRVCAGVWSNTIDIDRAADRVPPFGGLRRTAVTGRYARREFSPRPIAPLTFLSTAPDGRNKTT